MLKLIGTVTSPYVRKVRVVLAEKKIEYEFVQRAPLEESAEVRSLNPLGKVPVVLLDDGTTLFDSRVIVEYLDGLAANKHLLPPPGRERVFVKRWEALSDGICDAAVAIFLENKRPTKERDSAWIHRQQEKIDDGLAFAENILGSRTWCQGNAISLADISLGCALGYLSFRFTDIDWRSKHAPLVEIYDTLMQRPSFADTAPVA